jgi:hypothetical protein
MKRERLHLSVYTSIETGVDWNGRYYIAYANGASVFLRCPKEVRKWLKLPAKIPSREAYDSWIASLEAADQERVSKKAQPLTGEPLMEGNGPNLSQELLSTGFGPECHLDDSDPNHQTKMIT